MLKKREQHVVDHEEYVENHHDASKWLQNARETYSTVETLGTAQEDIQHKQRVMQVSAEWEHSS